MYRYSFLFIHSSVDGCFGDFQVVATVNSASLKVGVHLFFQTRVFSRYMPLNEIARSYGVSVFHFLISLHSACQQFAFPPKQRRDGFLSSSPSSIDCAWTSCWWPFCIVWGDTSWWVRFPFFFNNELCGTCFPVIFCLCVEFPSEIGFLKIWPVLRCSSTPSPRTCLEGPCHLQARNPCEMPQSASTKVWL